MKKREYKRKRKRKNGQRIFNESNKYKIYMVE
jgi:hypothetical protein